MNISFARLEEGYENAMKDYYKKQVCHSCIKQVNLEALGYLNAALYYFVRLAFKVKFLGPVIASVQHFFSLIDQPAEYTHRAADWRSFGT